MYIKSTLLPSRSTYFYIYSYLFLISILQCVPLRDRRRSVELRDRLGTERVAKVVRHGRLRWFGPVERKGRSDWVSACRELEVEGVRAKERDRKK
jgi:hypothetical protein